MSRSYASGAFVVAVTISVALPGAVEVFASIGREYLETVVVNSSVIVIATVESVEGLPSGGWKATGRVIDTLKGPKREAVTYGPSRSGESLTDDASAARVGETVVLLLESERNRISDLLVIAYAGYGRLPIHTFKGAQYVEAGSYFLRPETPTLKILVGNESHVVVPLQWLREFAKRPSSEVHSE
jgi:hypothetical protein